MESALLFCPARGFRALRRAGDSPSKSQSG
nr:MAG TPA: hypothetical protein [Caudoviricetes sp.]